MLKLMNLSTYSFDTERFDNNRGIIRDFVLNNGLQGIELMKPTLMDENIIPKELIKGVHLAHYPTWIDFWNGNEERLMKQVKDKVGILRAYGGLTRDVLVENYRKEIRAAEKLGANYGVFHISHVEIPDSYTYEYDYKDEDVVNASIDLINEIFNGFHSNLTLLLENLWWPGMTMKNRVLVEKLMKGINHDKVGIMLDTGHLMNTNVELRTEEQGVQYIIDTIENLGELKSYIKGMHFNCSLSGQYTMEQIKNNRNEATRLSLEEMEKDVYLHVVRIDNHKPFSSSCAKKIIDYVKPEYLVYEFITNDVEELKSYIKCQNLALK